MSTIFAPITSTIRSGVAIIRISGAKSTQCLKILGVKKNINHAEIKFCKIFNPINKELLDEVLIAFFQAPRSLTGEDVVEIFCHASQFIVKNILQILSSIEGMRMADPGEFSKIAFLNNKIDLVQAEAIPDLIVAESEAQHKQAIRQLQGDLGKIYESWRLDIIDLAALIESLIDFPDEDLPQNIGDEIENKVEILKQKIASHLDDQKCGQKIKDGLSLAIIGAPNVGKSSLLNFLAKSEVAIVSEFAGTTRDVVEIHLEISGVIVKIADTAGMHETQNVIEQEGIKRAKKKSAMADVKLFVVDATNPQLMPDFIDQNTIIINNKIDLKNAREISQAINISLVKKINTDLILTEIAKKIAEILPQHFSPLITQERYRVCLHETLSALANFSLTKNIELAAEDLRIAAFAIGKITGRVDVDDILDVVFSRFCIGK